MSIERRYPLLKHDHDAADITSGVFAPALLGSGTADSTKFLRGDSTWSNTLTGAFTANGTITSTTGGFRTPEQEGLRISHDNAYVSFYNTTGTTRRGFIQSSGANMYYYTEAASPVTLHRFFLQDVEYLQIGSSFVEIFQASLRVRPSAGTASVRLQSRTDTTQDANWIQWYRANGSTERGWLGFGSNGTNGMTLMSQLGGLVLQAQSGELQLVSNGSNLLRAFQGGNESTRWDGSGFHSHYQGRFTGWRGVQGTFDGPGAEIGYSGSSAFVIGYNRSGSAYVPLAIDASQITYTATSDKHYFNKPIIVETSGAAATFRNVELRTAGQALIGFGGYAGNWRPSLTIGSETSANYLFLLPPSTAGDPANIRATNNVDVWAGSNRVATFASASGYFVAHSWTRWETTNVGIFNVDGYYLYPSTAGDYRWFMRSGLNGAAALVLQDLAGTAKTWLYSSGSDFGLLDGAGNWALRYDNTNGAWRAQNGNREFWGYGFRDDSNSNYYFYSASGYSYGSFRLGGTRGGYVGLILDGTKRWTFMSDGTNVGLYNQIDSRWSYLDNNSGTINIFSTASRYIGINVDATWVNLTATGTTNWYMDKPLHVNGEIYRYLQGAMTHYGSSSFASGIITVQSGGSPSGGSDGDQFLIY